MILTPIPPERLDAALDRFAAQLCDPAARAAFARIRATSPERALGAVAESHRRQALASARACGMRVHPPGTRPGFNWDGAALDGDTEAYVILHEIAHFLLAAPEHRRRIDFGLGPGPDTGERAAAERDALVPILEREADEAAASLLGILWEAALGQPALASFLDQNWLEGLDRSAAAHFTAVLRRVTALGLVRADRHRALPAPRSNPPNERLQTKAMLVERPTARPAGRRVGLDRIPVCRPAYWQRGRKRGLTGNPRLMPSLGSYSSARPRSSWQGRLSRPSTRPRRRLPIHSPEH